MDRQFRMLAEQLDLIFPVCEMMLNELAGHRNVVVLPPIPAIANHGDSLNRGDQPTAYRTLVYAGTLPGSCGRMTRELTQAPQSDGRFRKQKQLR